MGQIENEGTFEKRNKPFDHINFGGIICPNGCEGQSFTVFHKRRPDPKFNELVFLVYCNECKTIISKLFSK